MTRTLTITRRAMGNSQGSELRLRGKWLYDLGFKPGMKVRVIERFSFLAGTKVLTLRPIRSTQRLSASAVK
jgi:Fe2+ transport system protein FeoA